MTGVASGGRKGFEFFGVKGFEDDGTNERAIAFSPVQFNSWEVTS